MPGAGIDVTGSSIRYVELGRNGHGLAVRSYGREMIPKGVLEHGIPKDKDLLRPAFESVRRALGTAFVVVSLPEEQAYLFTLTLPPLRDPILIRNTLEVQIEEHIPLKSTDVVFDFQVIGSTSEHTAVNVTALTRDIVERYRDAIVGAGFIPLAFEMQAQSLARAVVAGHKTSPMMVVDFGKTRTSIIITAGGHVRFTATVSVSGDDLTHALVKTLGMTVQKSQETKRKEGFVRTERNREVFNALLPPLSALKDEIERLMLYWTGHDSGAEPRPIEEIILSGGASRLKGFAEDLTYELKIPARRANPWTNFVSFEHYIPPIEATEAIAYTGAIGLAVRASGYYTGVL